MFKKAFAVMSSAALCAALMSAVPVSAALDNSSKTAQEIVNDMGIGINLGNTFEATYDKDGTVTGFETGWGSVEITKDIIDGYAAEGFKTLRIPVAWSNMMEEDYTIAPEYIARVKQVTQWAVDADLYVIVNEHWDSGWINYYPENKEEVMKHYRAIWTQVSDAFEDFDDHLILESQNEELGAWLVGKDEWLWNRWGSDTTNKQDAYDYALEFNQAFVDIVRSSGGNNDDRLLLISGICTDVDATCDELFKMPVDPANKMAVSVHYYTPTNYALSNNSTSWGEYSEYAELNGYMRKLKERFVDNGVPVIIGEACNGMEIAKKADGTARRYFAETCREAYERGMCPVLWDITYATNQPVENQIYNRRTQKMTDQELKKELAQIVADGHKKESSLNADDVTIKYGETAKLSFTTDQGSVSYALDNNTDIIEFGDDNTIKGLKPGSVKLTVFTEGDDEYAEIYKTVTVTVEKVAPPVSPDKEITVYGADLKTNADVKLPEGWVWASTVDLVEGQAVEATAIYNDNNYSNRTVKVSITWFKEEPASSSDSSDTSSSKSSSSAAGTTETKTTATGSTTNAATGAASAAPAFAVTALVGAAAIIAKKKNK